MADMKIGDKVRVGGEAVDVWQDYVDKLVHITVRTQSGGVVRCLVADASLVPPEPVTTLWTADCGHEVTDDTEVCVTPSETYCPQCAGNMIRELSGL